MKSELKCINELKKLPPNTKVRVYYKDEKGRGKPVKKPRMTLVKLSEQINSRFDKFEKDVNSRFDRVETRLDYIVKANNLKDISKK